MQAGRELDALVAEKVMGIEVQWRPWHDRHGNEGREPYMANASRQGRLARGQPLYSGGAINPYSTDISAAWEVVEKLRKSYRVRIHEFGSGWQASLEIKDGRLRYPIEISHEGDESANSDTAPHAICLAALKAVGIDIPD